MSAPQEQHHPSFMRRLGWLIVIWVASVATLAVAALAFRALMSAAGLTS